MRAPALVEAGDRPLRTLFLDAGGVLIHPNWDRVSRALSRHGVRTEPAVLAAADPRARHRMDTPELIGPLADVSRGEIYFGLVLEEAGVAASEATAAAIGELRAYHARSNLWEIMAPDLAPALAAFRKAGLRLVVVSNANGTLHRHLERLGLRDRFDLVLDSHLEGVEKPDPRLFEIALERSGARREETAHVGDLYHVDVLGARAAGLRAVLFDAAGLYSDRDCPRVPSLAALAEGVTT